MVLDYGLATIHRQKLASRGVNIIKCLKDGFIGIIRFRDIDRLAAETNYEQILLVDAGDIIFQADISHLFRKDVNCFRIVPEELHTTFYEKNVGRNDVCLSSFFNKMLSYLKNKPILNCGFVLGSPEKFRDFWQRYQQHCKGTECFGTDQMFFNYVVYQDGFEPLEQRYNFVLITSKSPYSIREGVFYDDHGEIIPVVHNAGGRDKTRVINRFGYGRDRNKKNGYHHSSFGHLSISTTVGNIFQRCGTTKKYRIIYVK